MAFNIIGRSGSVPAIFGDAKDMAFMTNVLVDRNTGTVTLEISNANPRKRKQQVPVSKQIAAVMRDAKHVLAVAVDRFGDTEKAEVISLEPLSYGKRTPLPLSALTETVNGLLQGKLTIDTVVHRAGIRRFGH